MFDGSCIQYCRRTAAENIVEKAWADGSTAASGFRCARRDTVGRYAYGAHFYAGAILGNAAPLFVNGVTARNRKVSCKCLWAERSELGRQQAKDDDGCVRTKINFPVAYHWGDEMAAERSKAIAAARSLGRVVKLIREIRGIVSE